MTGKNNFYLSSYYSRENNFNINVYKKCFIIVKSSRWSFMIAAAQAEVKNPRLTQK